MKANYSFLKDELAIMEIRRHKWIESQKRGAEMGFASAAIDWINKYGNDWLIARLDSKDEDNLFMEKRVYRRVDRRIPLQIRIHQDRYISHTKDINLVGLSCVLSKEQIPQSKAKVMIDFGHKNLRNNKTCIFESKIERVSQVKAVDNHTYYKVFLPFPEDVRNYLRINKELILGEKSL